MGMNTNDVVLFSGLWFVLCGSVHYLRLSNKQTGTKIRKGYFYMDSMRYLYDPCVCNIDASLSWTNGEKD